MNGENHLNAAKLIIISGGEMRSRGIPTIIIKGINQIYTSSTPGRVLGPF